MLPTPFKSNLTCCILKPIILKILKKNTQMETMINKEQIILLLKEYKKKQADKFGVTKMGVFGSIARGNANEDSDIDIVVELNKRNLLNRIGLKMSLEDFLGMPVDVVTYRENLSHLLKERISKDVIYV